VGELRSRAVLTPDYGILAEKDIRQFNGKMPVKYRNDLLTNYTYWQCFAIEDVAPRYREWRDVDPLGREGAIVTLCDFDIWVKKTDPAHDYHNNRAYEVTFCDKFREAWRRLTGNEKYICLAASPDLWRKEMVDGKSRMVRSWSWERIQTKKGCYPHFDGECPE
jgi:hypothetical protein